MVNKTLKRKIEALGVRARRGSKPRCHLLTDVSRELVADTLSKLIQPYGRVEAKDSWMPNGFAEAKEAELDKPTGMMEYNLVNELRFWWRAVPRGGRSPNFDIASTCTIEGKKGMLLVEAKAHRDEFLSEAIGKKPPNPTSQNSHLNHERIAKAIYEANQGLQKETGLKWGISRDCYYQLSNRFAWAWKMADLGVPVILLYLGFTQADDLAKNKEVQISDIEHWAEIVKYSSNAVPFAVWNKKWKINGCSFVPLLRAFPAAPLSS